MLSGVSITCFTACYLVALLLEVTRLKFRSGIRGAVLLAFAGVGLFAHTVYLSNRAVHVAGSPLSSQHDWYLVVAWVIVAGYLFVTCWNTKTAFGLFVFPLVLGLVGVAAWLADTQPYAREPASKIWGTIHGTSILLSTVAVFVGFLAGVMYLGLARRLKRKLPPRRGLRLPSLEQLEQTGRRAVLVSAPLMGVGLVSGVVLNSIHGSGRLPWHDPLIVCTFVAFAWLATAAIVSMFYAPARRGRTAAYITVTSFVLLIGTLAAGLLVDTRHGGAAPDIRAAQRSGLAGVEAAWETPDAVWSPRVTSQPSNTYSAPQGGRAANQWVLPHRCQLKVCQKVNDL